MWKIGEVRYYDPVEDADAFPGGCYCCKPGPECKFRKFRPVEIKDDEKKCQNSKQQ